MWIKTIEKVPVKEVKNVNYFPIEVLAFHRGQRKVLYFDHKNNYWLDPELGNYFCDLSEVGYWMKLPDVPN